MKRFAILSILFGVISVIGSISYLAGTRAVNLGAFVFPAALAAAFAFLAARAGRGK